MPSNVERGRGGAVRYRSVRLPGGKYMTVAVVKKAGPRGGHTVAAGKIRKAAKRRKKRG